jgi:hypothetical protein
MCIGSHVKYQLFLSDFDKTYNFFTDFRKILKYQLFMRLLPVRHGIFYADGRTDTTKLIVASRTFAREPKRCYSYTKFEGGLSHLFQWSNKIFFIYKTTLEIFTPTISVFDCSSWGHPQRRKG